MYSPKISQDLIPKLYRLAKAGNIPMTELVNQLITEGIARLEQAAENVNEPSTPLDPRKSRGTKSTRRRPYGG